MNWFKLLFTGKAVFNIIVNDIPEVMEDNKISLNEIINLIIKIASVFNYKIEFEIPKDMKSTAIDVISYTKNV